MPALLILQWSGFFPVILPPVTKAFSNVTQVLYLFSQILTYTTKYVCDRL